MLASQVLAFFQGNLAVILIVRSQNQSSFFQSSGTRLRRSASASRRDTKEAKFREKIAELEDIIRHQTQQFERTQQELVSHYNYVFESAL